MTNISNLPFINACGSNRKQKSNLPLQQNSFIPKNSNLCDKVCLSENKQTANKEENPVVVLCDNFSHKLIDVDNDGIPELSHGLFVHKAIDSKNPDIKINDVDINKYIDPKDNKKDFATDEEEGRYLFIRDNKGVVKALKNISKRIDNGENIKAVNLSFGIDFDVPMLAAAMKAPITPKNIKEYKNSLRDKFLSISGQDEKKADENLSYFRVANRDLSKDVAVEIGNTIKAVEDITKKGVNVFTSAGNCGSKFAGILSLAKGVTPVGAIDPKTQNVAKYSANNSLVKKFELGTVRTKPVIKDDRIVGYNINGKNEIDIPVEKSTGGRFIGQNPENLMASDKDYRTIQQYQRVLARFRLKEEDLQEAWNKIYDPGKLGKILGLNPAEIDKRAKTCDYTDAKFSLALKVDKDNKLQLRDVYVPLNRSGTSFASPKSAYKSVEDPDYMRK